MTDLPGWHHKVTQAFARSPQPATQLDKRHVRLRTFQRQLGQLRDMAETAHDSLTASYYESVWREMGEELAFLTRDVDTGQLTADDMTAAFEEWQTKGRAHLRHHPEAAQIFQLIDLGGGATLQLPSDRQPDAQAARTNANDEALGRRLDDLMGRAEQAEFDAERLDDADRPQAAEQLRENARDLMAQADQLARESGLGSVHTDDGGQHTANRDADAGRSNDADALADNVDDDADDRWKGPEELFEESMDAAYLDHQAANGVDPQAELEDADDPVPAALRGKGWLGEPLTDADRASVWRAVGTRQEPPYGDFPAPGDARRTEVQSGTGADTDGSAARDRAGDLAAEAEAADRAGSKSQSAGDSHSDKPKQQADDESEEDSDAATDDRGVSELTRAADASPTDAAEAEPVAATETTACAIAVTRAHCAVDRAHRQLDTAEQAAADDRTAELTRWHADDTRAQQAANDTAMRDSAAVHGE